MRRMQAAAAWRCGRCRRRPRIPVRRHGGVLSPSRRGARGGAGTGARVAGRYNFPAHVQRFLPRFFPGRPPRGPRAAQDGLTAAGDGGKIPQDPGRRRRARSRAVDAAAHAPRNPPRPLRVRFRRRRRGGPPVPQGAPGHRRHPVGHQHAEDDRPGAAGEGDGHEHRRAHGHGLGLRRHQEHPHGDEPRRLRLRDQAGRLRRPARHARSHHQQSRRLARSRALPQSADEVEARPETGLHDAAVDSAVQVSEQSALPRVRQHEAGPGCRRRFLRHHHPARRPARRGGGRRVRQGRAGRAVHDVQLHHAARRDHQHGRPRRGAERGQRRALPNQRIDHVRDRVLRGVQPDQRPPALRQRRPQPSGGDPRRRHGHRAAQGPGRGPRGGAELRIREQ